MNINKKQRIRLNIILLGLLLSFFTIILTTPLHEAAHWIMSDIDPYIEPVEFHLFDDTCFKNGQNILSSGLGCVIIKEKYAGAFKDRPVWADALQEIICVSIQIILAVIITLKTLVLIIKKYPKFAYTNYSV